MNQKQLSHDPNQTTQQGLTNLVLAFQSLLILLTILLFHRLVVLNSLNKLLLHKPSLRKATGKLGRQ